MLPRLRLMQTKTMLGHLMSVAQGDQTVTRRVDVRSRGLGVLENSPGGISADESDDKGGKTQ
jgi:sensor domain CHASE-containing protein